MADASVDGSSPAVALDGATLAYGARLVLDRISLCIPQGRFVGVLGPNGAGKTTLVRALLGLVRPAHGAVQVLGSPARPGNPLIGYAPQQRTLAPGGAALRGWDFVASAWQAHRWGLPWLDRDGRREVGRALALVEAEALALRPLAELSGGERQRLLLAQALLGRPRLLLLDEPLIHLDPARQAAVVDLVRRVQQELGIAVLFSAHELNPLLPALDEVLVLGGGRAALGPVDQVITGPVLSQLYGAPVEVLRLPNGRILVLQGGIDVQHMEHALHEHDGHGPGQQDRRRRAAV